MIHLSFSLNNNWLTYIFLLAALLLTIAAIANTLFKIRSVKEFIKDKHNNKGVADYKTQKGDIRLKAIVALVFFLILLVTVAVVAWFVIASGDLKMRAATIALIISFLCGISFGVLFLWFLYKRINK